jgi:hypothetical protein
MRQRRFDRARTVSDFNGWPAGVRRSESPRQAYDRRRHPAWFHQHV